MYSPYYACETRWFPPSHQPLPLPICNDRHNWSFGTPTLITTDRLNNMRAGDIRGPGSLKEYLKENVTIVRKLPGASTGSGSCNRIGGYQAR
jgi:hypothetical protein